MERLDNAQIKLSSDKAVGLDLFPDIYIKNTEIYEGTKEKFRDVFEAWYNGREYKEWVTTGRTYLGSKTEH
jgi:hypothetical protein